MILGVGIELVETPRFQRAVERFGARLLRRLFTADEQSYAGHGKRGVDSLAVRFAAKSAARRALGARGVRWCEIEVVREDGQAPRLRLHGRAGRAARARGVDRTLVSLTHDASACVAQVVLEGSA